MTTTELIAVPDDLKRLVQTGAIDISELMTRLAVLRAATEGTPQQETPEPPKQIVLSPADKSIMRSLPKQLADIELPDSPRLLTEEERATLVPLFDKVKVALKAITKAENAIKEAMHGHIDTKTASDEAVVDKNGHLLTEGEVVAPEYDKKVVRGLTGGGGIVLSDLDLQELEESGAITHKQYLDMTKLVPARREPVAESIMAVLAKNPEILSAIAAVAKKSPIGTSIRMAAN